MSRKTGVGAVNRQYLFEASKYELTNEEKDVNSPAISEKKSPEQSQQQHCELDNNLKLEQINGHNGHILRSVVAFPGDSSRFVKAVGSSVVIVNTSDSTQTTLFGHDAFLSCMSFSPSGRYLATGQVGSRKIRGGIAKALVWDMQSHRVVTSIDDIQVGVTMLKFSPDELFLLMSALDGSIRIWDIKNSELASGINLPRPLCLAEWVSVFTETSLDKSNSYRKKSYVIAMSTGQATWLTSFHFDTTKMQWSIYPSNATQVLDIHNTPPLTLGAYAIAIPHGLQSRASNPDAADGGNSLNSQAVFTCSALCPDGSYLFAGQSTGEVAVFRLASSGTYRGSLPVCRGVVVTIITLPVSSNRYDLLVCGGNDIKQLNGGDMRWEVIRCFPTRPSAIVTSMTMAANSREMIVGFADGEIVRQLMDISDACPLQIESGHTSNVNSLSFLSADLGSVDIFATTSDDGSAKVWSLEVDNNRLATRVLKSINNINGRCSCWMTENDVHMLIVGDVAGTISCLHGLEANDNRPVWAIPSAHRGQVTCVCVATDKQSGVRFLISGGVDCSVRIWRINLSTTSTSTTSVPSHQPVIDTRMSQAIRKITADLTNIELVHISDDRSIQSFNIKRAKLSAVYDYRSMFPSSTLVETAQKIDMMKMTVDGKLVNYSDNEIVTSDNTGRIMFWDTNYPSSSDKMTANLSNVQLEMVQMEHGSAVHQEITCIGLSSVHVNGLDEFVMAFGSSFTDSDHNVHFVLKIVKLPPSPSVLSHLSNVCRRDGVISRHEDAVDKFQAMELKGIGVGHTDQITHVAFGYNVRNAIVSAGRDGCVCAWRLK